MRCFAASLLLAAACSTTRPALFLEDYRGREVDVITADGQTRRARVSGGPGFAFYVADDVTVASNNVARVVYTDRWMGALHGLGLGVLGGVALGSMRASTPPFGCVGCDDGASFGASSVLYGVVGAVVGGVIGAAYGRSVTFSFETAEDRRLLVDPSGVTWKF